MAHYDDKLVYVRIPKCASSFIVNLLEYNCYCTEKLGLVHAPPALVMSAMSLLKGRFSFTCVRHPLEFIASVWREGMTEGWVNNRDLLGQCRNNNFEKFVENYLKYCPGRVSQIYELYCGTTELDYNHSLITDIFDCSMPPIGTWIDWYLRTETVVSDLISMFEHLDMPFTIRQGQRRVNVSKVGPERTVYPDSLRDAVMQAEQKAIKRFGYGEWVPVQHWSAHKLITRPVKQGRELIT